CTVKEVLRFMPPVPVLSRTNTKDEMFNGYFIPKNTPLFISIYAIHHDPSIWGDDTEYFNPSRWLNPGITSNTTSYNFIPFSTGPRTCVGIKMGILEVKTILAVIIRNLEFKLVEGFTFGVKWRLKVDDNGRQTWHYLDENDIKNYHQSSIEKYWIGLPFQSKTFEKPKIAFEAAQNGFEFFKQLQTSNGHWACEFSGYKSQL
ncbi:12343_t:CDS:2, partial [Cetraspora pellucida]